MQIREMYYLWVGTDVAGLGYDSNRIINNENPSKGNSNGNLLRK